MDKNLVGVWRHKKTDGRYVIVGKATIEATMTPAIVYKSLLHNNLWVRPEAEFMDGRFEKLEAEQYER